ncbi:alpha-glucosidase C-terminal domain-containing protein [Caloramator sp. mosi_1]|uniref:alpha-glucosidase C-terminal domain-containing protein n=1 Tax=Caloramator sp. mosi_1 TaxID=3023090 RepID=UPI003FCDDE23
MVAYGEYIPLCVENNSVFAYARRYKDELIVVVNNFYGQDAKVSINEIDVEGETKILLSNYKDSGSDLKNLNLRPYESIIYYIVK